jgi:hypothetical protein
MTYDTKHPQTAAFYLAFNFYLLFGKSVSKRGVYDTNQKAASFNAHGFFVLF